MRVFAVLVLLIFVAGCITNDVKEINKTSNGSSVEIQKLVKNRSVGLHYQLQGASYENLKQLDVGFLVVDVDESKLTTEEVSELRKSGKIVLSYLSIGEAESYRDYWKSDWRVGNPSFIDEENPNWPKNYKVKYWEPEWQEIILNKTRIIAERGYDGVYLDIIDAYSYYEDRGVEDANERMIQFVKKIRDEGRKVNPNFLIVPQNAIELYDFEEYGPLVNGFGKEDTWYYDDALQNTEQVAQELSYLDRAVKDGKFVLAIDYPTVKSNVCDFYAKCKIRNYSCTVSNRALDRNEPLKCS